MTDLAAAVESVVPLMAEIAVKLGHPHGSPLFDDLLAAARLRLVKAWPKFDPARKVKWVTFAYTVITRAMLNEIEAARRPRPVAVETLEAEAPTGGEFSGVCVESLLSDPAIPRLYRRALRAGGAAGVVRSGLPQAEGKRVYQWATHAIRRRLADRPR